MISSRKAHGIFAVLISIVLCSFVNCKSTNTSTKVQQQTNLFETYWLVEILDDQKVELAEPAQELYLYFSKEDGIFNGNTGCNKMSGTLRKEKMKLSFSDIRTTKKACIDAQYENTFKDLLSKVDNFEIQGEQLLLKQQNKVIISLKAKL